MTSFTFVAAVLESEAFGTYSRAQLQAQEQQPEALKRKELLQQGPSAVQFVGLPDCNGKAFPLSSQAIPPA